MSVLATLKTWKLTKAQVTSPEKLFLLSCADRAGESHECWPSIKRLCADTGLDRKTIIKVRQSVIDKKLMEYTGAFAGRSEQIPVMRLTYIDDSQSELTSPKIGMSTSPKNGTGDQSQNWDTEPKRENLKEEPITPIVPKKNKLSKSVSYPLEEILNNNPHSIPEEHIIEWQAHRKKPITKRVWDKTNHVMDCLIKLGHSGILAFEYMLERQWEGMELRYFDNMITSSNNRTSYEKPLSAFDLAMQHIKQKGNTYDENGAVQCAKLI